MFRVKLTLVTTCSWHPRQQKFLKKTPSLTKMWREKVLPESSQCAFAHFLPLTHQVLWLCCSPPLQQCFYLIASRLRSRHQMAEGCFVACQSLDVSARLGMKYRTLLFAWDSGELKHNLFFRWKLPSNKSRKNRPRRLGAAFPSTSPMRGSR